MGTTAVFDDLNQILESDILVQTKLDDKKGQDFKRPSGQEGTKDEKSHQNKSKDHVDTNPTLPSTCATMVKRNPFDKSTLLCNLCLGKGHWTSQCMIFRNQNSSQIMKLVKEKKICWRCLKIHNKEDCTSKWLCTRCDNTIAENKRKHANQLHEHILSQ